MMNRPPAGRSVGASEEGSARRGGGRTARAAAHRDARREAEAGVDRVWRSGRAMPERDAENRTGIVARTATGGVAHDVDVDEIERAARRHRDAEGIVRP